MTGSLRVALLDLLVERAEFGHGGNMEVLSPLANLASSLEVWLLTPQFQSDSVGLRASSDNNPILLETEDLPTWDDAFSFVSESSATEIDGDIILRRIALPNTGHEAMTEWLVANSVDVVICSGSRRNVSMWEPWMDSAAALLLGAVTLELPTLGICFGHQLICQALGGEVSRASERTDLVVELELSKAGLADPIFSGLSSPVCLFTHQDHVVEISKRVIVLGSAPHNSHATVRILGEGGGKLPIWGLQFHPEAARKRIERSVKLGHISNEEAAAFGQEHDGAQVLANFADEAMKNRF
ncbi:MAG: gamma-glutamyl-gamma-aminobutyrate hydrolase family protein [Candidatus Thalassarchaeaceae archaeon]|nr:gamma-glutamyl-gamma-aminobutyrate hydrolase family protein [Candidatus Thalassarchaeaceae archaeon]